MGPRELERLIASYDPLSQAEGAFLKIVLIIYTAYLDRMHTTDQDDFDGLMQQAALLVQGGQNVFERKSGRGDLSVLKHIAIDEFQDFSELFHQLISSIRKHNTNAHFFCVGDDWQAINGFAGSNLKFFQQFEDYFESAIKLQISTNYRSKKRIVEAGNALMYDKGKPARSSKSDSGNVLLGDLGKFQPKSFEDARFSGDAISPSVRRIINSVLKNGCNVVLLSRRNTIPWYVSFQNDRKRTDKGLDQFKESICVDLPEEMAKKVSISTVHKYKGLEKDVVIILDAIQRSYPLIHPDWVFTRALGDHPETIVAEERRLFYVALTRAVDTLFVITEKQSESSFLNDMQGFKFQSVQWLNYSPPATVESHKVVKVGNQEHKKPATVHIKDQLKGTGYRWSATDWPSWNKVVSWDSLSLEKIMGESWANTADGVEVRICSSNDNEITRYHINSGNWTEIKLA